MVLKISEGLSNSQIKDLIDYSNSDSLIITKTNDSTRFGNVIAVENWLKKKRCVYALTDNKNKLHGIIWFGKKQFPIELKDKYSKFGMTFAIRIYGNTRGKGFAKKFLKDAFSKYKKTDEYLNAQNNRFWLTTDPDNLAAIKVYGYLGFKRIPYVAGNKIIMIAEKV